MGAIANQLTVALKAMDVEKVSKIMDEFQEQSNNL